MIFYIFKSFQLQNADLFIYLLTDLNTFYNNKLTKCTIIQFRV
jgi:hypothetical protein